MANSSETRLAYIAETEWGTTPATPAFTPIRFTGESLAPNIETTTSQEIRADRNITDLIQTGQSAGGGVNFELSYGALDDLLESLMFSTWDTDVLKNGLTQKSFTLEKTFETGATDQYRRFAGSVASGMSLSIAVGSPVTGSMDFLSKGMTTGEAIITGATYGSATANDVINPHTGFAALTMTGVTSPEVTAINLTIANNLRTRRVLGSMDAASIGTGRFEVTGDVEVYLKDKDALDLFLAGTSSTLSFKLGGASSKNYVFSLPKIKFTSAEEVAGGIDQDVMVKLGFQGLYSTDSTLSITRTA